MSKLKHASYEQFLLFVGWFGGMIFVLSTLFLFEIPSIIQEGNGWSLIIIVPLLLGINYISIRNLIVEWRKNDIQE